LGHKSGEPVNDGRIVDGRHFHRAFGPLLLIVNADLVRAEMAPNVHLWKGIFKWHSSIKIDKFLIPK
jgi:hypothetical protein